MSKAKPITELPSKPGRYNINFEGALTMMPLFATFDGKEWHMQGMTQMFMREGRKCTYFSNDPEETVANDSPSM